MKAWLSSKFKSDVAPVFEKQLGPDWVLSDFEPNSGVAFFRRSHGVIDIEVIVSPIIRRNGVVRFQTQLAMCAGGFSCIELESGMNDCRGGGAISEDIRIAFTLYVDLYTARLEEREIQLCEYDSRSGEILAGWRKSLDLAIYLFGADEEKCDGGVEMQNNFSSILDRINLLAKKDPRIVAYFDAPHMLRSKLEALVGRIGTAIDVLETARPDLDERLYSANMPPDLLRCRESRLLNWLRARKLGSQEAAGSRGHRKSGSGL
jgi:hypothetical protein